MDIAGPSRAVYLPSGRVAWSRFLPGLFLAGLAAISMAWCLFWALEKGFYLIFIAPLLAALAVGGIWSLVLSGSHCRNRAIATVGSVLLGLLLYFGYYHIGLLQFIGIRNAHRIDVLPRYVQFRMKTDVARDVHHRGARGGRPRGPDRVQQAFNWVFFGGELLAVIGVLVAIGRHCTSKAYCEACGKWMRSETLKLPPGRGAAAWDALQRGDHAEVHRHLADTSRRDAIGAVVAVEHCPGCPAEDRSNAVYLTVKDVPIPGAPDPIAARVGSLFRPRPTAGLRTLVDHVGLDPEEVGALARSFPGLHGTIGAHPHLFAEEQSAAREIDRAVDVTVDEWTDRVARIEPVDPLEAGTVLTRRNAIVQTIIGVVTTLGGLVVALAPAGVLLNLDPEPPDWVSGVALVWMFGWMAFSLVWCLFFARYATSRFMRGQTRRAFELRPNPAVDLNDPELVFVDIIPRINWGKAMMENASDIGFLQLDRRRRQLLFEGDRERYGIPVESILEVKHEFWAESVQHQLQKEPSLNHVVVVRAMTADGPWETWFYQRHNQFRPQTAKRRLADALELEVKIRELMGKATADRGPGTDRA